MSRVRTSPVFQLVKIGAATIAAFVAFSLVAAAGWMRQVEGGQL